MHTISNVQQQNKLHSPQVGFCDPMQFESQLCKGNYQNFHNILKLLAQITLIEGFEFVDPWIISNAW